MNEKANSKSEELPDIEDIKLNSNPKPNPRAGDKRNRDVGSLSSVSGADTSLNEEIQVKQKRKSKNPKIRN